MFYRRKIILSILEVFGGNLPKISLQKLLFLFTMRQQKKEYDFVPYQYGCYSFSANADLIAMISQKILTEDTNGYSKLDKTIFSNTLKSDDKSILSEIYRLYSKSSALSLMKMTYLNYQYYAINSVKAKEVLDEDQYAKVVAAKPVNQSVTLYTIGYEGISLEEYLNRLIINNVKVLVDVRRNPLSMKFGFSKSQIKNFCAKVNIEYLHIPEVGIQSDQRQELHSQEDYNALFDIYKDVNLRETGSQQKQILNLLIEKKRIALTCFEANICQCHRKHLAEAIVNLPEWKFELKHI